jgi:transposase
MLYVGLDIHSKQTTICVLNEQNQVVRRSQVRGIHEVLQALDALPERFEACFEASTGYGRWYEMLKLRASRVVVAHPGLLKLIYRSKKKNDRRDAQQLAKLLLCNMVPAVHVPRADVRAWREMIAFRRTLIQKRTKAKNGMRSLLKTVGLQAPSRAKLWTKAGMSWLKGQQFTQELHALQRDMLVQEIETLSDQVRRVERQLNRIAGERTEIWQLRTIPGVGPRTAEAIVAFVDDPHRFSCSKKVGAYFGLVPSQDQSGDKNRLGHITRQGSATCRQLLTEATWQALRRSPTVRAYFERVRRDDPSRRRIAVVATAHYLARVMWAMLKNGTLWKETCQSQAA